jgi:hypothetical protein
MLNALFDLRHFNKFEVILKKFETYYKTPQDNTMIISDPYLGIYSPGENKLASDDRNIQGRPCPRSEITEKLKEYDRYIDHHRILVFNYKIATLYFGSGDYNTSIDYLHLIINDHVDLAMTCSVMRGWCIYLLTMNWGTMNSWNR